MIATKLICDLCSAEMDNLGDLGQLEPSYCVPGRVKYACVDCLKNINKKLDGLRVYYGNEMSKDMREFLLDLAANTKKKGAILTA